MGPETYVCACSRIRGSDEPPGQRQNSKSTWDRCGRGRRDLPDAGGGQTLRQKGVDIVVAYFEPHGRKETIAKTEGLESIPRRILTYAATPTSRRWTPMRSCARKPAVAVVDEFAHTNVPGSERLKRWQDVDVILAAGIDVLTSMNVQHMESLNDQVWHSTGVRVRETVPDWVVDEADEVVLVDLTPRALRNRLERGVVYPQEKAQRALDNFFTEGNLTALREMAMRHTAHEVEEKLDADPSPSGVARPPDGRKEESPDLPYGEPVLRGSDPQGEARGGLPAGRLPGDPRVGHSREPRRCRAPYELRSQSEDCHPCDGVRRCFADHRRVRPSPGSDSDLHGPLADS